MKILKEVLSIVFLIGTGICNQSNFIYQLESKHPISWIWVLCFLLLTIMFFITGYYILKQKRDLFLKISIFTLSIFFILFYIQIDKIINPKINTLKTFEEKAINNEFIPHPDSSLLKQANEDNVDALIKVGLFYSGQTNNSLLSINFEKARHYFELAKDHHDPRAYLYLGSMYEKGLDLSINEKKALSIYEEGNKYTNLTDISLDQSIFNLCQKKQWKIPQIISIRQKDRKILEDLGLKAFSSNSKLSDKEILSIINLTSKGYMEADRLLALYYASQKKDSLSLVWAKKAISKGCKDEAINILLLSSHKQNLLTIPKDSIGVFNIYKFISESKIKSNDLFTAYEYALAGYKLIHNKTFKTEDEIQTAQQHLEIVKQKIRDEMKKYSNPILK